MSPESGKGHSHGKWRGTTQNQLENHDETLDDHEKRITRLEKVKWVIIGAVMMLGINTGSASMITEVLKVIG